MSAALVLPEPQRVEVDQVADLARQLVAWADGVDDIAVVRDAAARWGAITEYVRRTSNTGVAEAEAALRRLEVRIGLLLGPAPVGRPTSGTSVAAELPDHHARNEFRMLAAHADIVEAVIADSTDAKPPSRARCLQTIARKRDEADLAEAIADGERLAPAILAALDRLPPEELGDWMVTLRFTATHIDDVRFALPDEAEVVTIEEVR